MLNPSDYGVASPQEILKDTSQGSLATNLHWQVSANLTIRVRRYLGLAYRAKGSSSFASKVQNSTNAVGGLFISDLHRQLSDLTKLSRAILSFPGEV